MKPYARWTNDCQGKQDFDGSLVSVNTRYWPGPEGGGSMGVDISERGVEFSTVPYGDRPSAHCSIDLDIGPEVDGDGGPKTINWRERRFEADSEAAVKREVENWAEEQMEELARRIGLNPEGREYKPNNYQPKLVYQIAKRTRGLQLQQIRAVLDVAFDEIVRAVRDEGRFHWVDFGVWTRTTRKARKILNPQTKKPMRLPRTRSMRFRPSKSVREGL